MVLLSMIQRDAGANPQSPLPDSTHFAVRRLGGRCLGDAVLRAERHVADGGDSGS